MGPGILEEPQKKVTLPKTNIVPENKPSQKEIHLPTVKFQVLLLLVSGRVGYWDATKALVNHGKFTMNLNWLAGFLKHQQYF